MRTAARPPRWATRVCSTHSLPSSIVNSTSIRSRGVALERLEDVVELARELGQALGERVERLGVADAGDDVLALGVVEDLAVDLGRAGRRVARERDAAARRLLAVAVAEHHRLHDAGGADRVVDAAELAVGLGARAVPRAEDGVDALLDLRARRLREVADQREQRLDALAAASHGSSPAVGASSSASSTTPAEMPRTVVANESSRRS